MNTSLHDAGTIDKNRFLPESQDRHCEILELSGDEVAMVAGGESKRGAESGLGGAGLIVGAIGAAGLGISTLGIAGAIVVGGAALYGGYNVGSFLYNSYFR